MALAYYIYFSAVGENANSFYVSKLLTIKEPKTAKLLSEEINRLKLSFLANIRKAYGDSKLQLNDIYVDPKNGGENKNQLEIERGYKIQGRQKNHKILVVII
jgi:hypothetical protein